MIIKEQEYFKEQLLLIHTNSTQRELTDFEKMEQISRTKELLLQWRGKEKVSGRTRDIIAKLLDTSTSQIARMESINNNLINDFKEQFKKGIINTSVAYEVSGMPEEKQQEFFQAVTDQEQLSVKKVQEVKKVFAGEKLEVQEDIPKGQETPIVEPRSEAVEQEPLQGQVSIYDNLECLQVIEAGVSFTEWLSNRYGESQYKLIGNIVKENLEKESDSIEQMQNSITNSISVWMLKVTMEYQEYLKISFMKR